MKAKLKWLKERRKAIIAGLGAGAGAAATALPDGITDMEWLSIALTAASVGIATWAVRNGDKQPKPSPDQITYDRRGGYR